MQRYKIFADRWHPVKDDWGDYVLHYDAMLEIRRLTALACERPAIIEEQMQEIAALKAKVEQLKFGRESLPCPRADK